MESRPRTSNVGHAIKSDDMEKRVEQGEHVLAIANQSRAWIRLFNMIFVLSNLRADDNEYDGIGRGRRKDIRAQAVWADDFEVQEK